MKRNVYFLTGRDHMEWVGRVYKDYAVGDVLKLKSCAQPLQVVRHRCGNILVRCACDMGSPTSCEGCRNEDLSRTEKELNAYCCQCRRLYSGQEAFQWKGDGYAPKHETGKDDEPVPAQPVPVGGDDTRHAVPDGVYAFTEVDVDGCGTDATEYVAFDRGLPDGALDDLRGFLAQAKKRAAENEWSTSDIVEDALAQFEKATGIHGEISFPPILGTIEF